MIKHNEIYCYLIIFLMIIKMILHMDDNILMEIEMIPSLIMISFILFYFRGVMPVSDVKGV